MEFRVLSVSGDLERVTISFTRDLIVEKARLPQNFEILPEDVEALKVLAVGKIVTLSGLKLKMGTTYTIKIGEGLRDIDGKALPEEERIIKYKPRYAKRRIRVGVVQPLMRWEWEKYYAPIEGGKPLEEEYLNYIGELFDEVGEMKPDITGITEAIIREFQTIPGPYFNMLAEKAKKYKMYVVAQIPERDGAKRYSTGVIIDRDGNLVGKYRKVHQPGVAEGKPTTDLGDSFPVFETDFGKVGIMICYDMIAQEVVRALTINGAEIIFFPHGTGDVTVSEMNMMLRCQALALMNCVYIVPCSFGRMIDRGHGGGFGRSCIIAPTGLIMADAGRRPGVTSTIIDLEEKRLVTGYGAPGINDAKYRIMAERRPEVYKDIVKPKNV